MDLQRITELIIGIAQEAGAGVLASYGSHPETTKYDGTLVTEADPAAEALIRERLQKHFPEHSIYGEELGFAGPRDNEWVWYLDPIDGTSNYVFGLPLWGVSIGLTHRGRCVAGVIEMPALRETFWAWEGGGAFCNGRRLQASLTTTMQDNDLLCISSTIVQRYDFSFPQKIRALGSAAYALAALASGAFVGLIHDNWRLHDVAAGMVLCQETGLIATCDDGSPFESFENYDPDAPAPTLILATPQMHPQIMECVRLK